MSNVSHPLLDDADQPGWWGWIDRNTERGTRFLNPILIKEARQALKSKQFGVTFFLLLLASWFWMVIGVVMASPDIYYVPSGVYLMTGYFLLLSVPMIAMVPLAAHRSLAAELDEGTFELLAITKLSALRIVTGKLGSAVLQMLVYFAALVPAFGFCYLLRGIDLVMISLTLGLVFMASLLLTTFGLLLATAVQNKAGQIFALLFLLFCILMAEVFCGSFAIGVVMAQQLTWEVGSFNFLLLFGAVAISFMVLFVQAAAARIAPVTENRSTRLRWIMFIQQLLWVAAMAGAAFYDNDAEILFFGIVMLGAYWTLMGTLMLGESAELSPRVLRTMPQTTFGRMMLLWLCPGPGTGFMFAILSAIAGIATLSSVVIVFGKIAGSSNPVMTSGIVVGYLMMYLGATRLIVLPLSRRIGNSFLLPVSVMVILLVLGVVTPSIFMAITTGAPSSQYGAQEFTNWMWTLSESSGSRFAFGVEMSAFLIAVIGGGLFVLNLFLLVREFSYRRVSVPARVAADDQEQSSVVALGE
ncbi:hypothetical protein Q31b_16110 [Novipirellula aureliae]|uniref:ABC-2 family transporter protein n=1 Tax=Novipirellula aureliae TaxID=2527966 RepID=A0A5C6E999_9BACT|nr:hypothetical protein [Novipirellula aureliae]TWU44076.1 hypothetical protein Q31b_16110 [Novipirellula aureliae]